MINQRVLKMDFAKIYQLYIQKIEKKNRQKSELDSVIFWLCGYNESSLAAALNKPITVGEFFFCFPSLNKNAHLIKGSVCGCKLEDITDPTEKNMRLLDKVVDELAKGWSLEKIFRK